MHAYGDINGFSRMVDKIDQPEFLKAAKAFAEESAETIRKAKAEQTEKGHGAEEKQEAKLSSVNPDVKYSSVSMAEETDTEKAERLRNAKLTVTTANNNHEDYSIQLLQHIKKQRATPILKAIAEKFNDLSNLHNRELDIEFSLSSTAISRSASHQIDVTKMNYEGQALVFANLAQMCKNAYPAEVHIDEKPKSGTKIHDVVTLYSVLQDGENAVFAKMTVKIPEDQKARLHMVVSTEIKKGTNLTLITGLENVPVGKNDSFEITLPQFLNYVKDYPEFVKRIPVDKVVSSYDAKFSTVTDRDIAENYMELAKEPEKNMEQLQRMVDEAAKKAGYSIRMFHGAKNGGGFTVFRDWSYFTQNEAYARRYMNQSNREDRDSLYSVYVKLGKTFDTRKAKDKKLFNQIRMEMGLGEIGERGLPDWTDGYDLSEYIEENELPYDSIVLDEGGDMVNGKPVYRGDSYVVRDSSSVKSAAPVTYDDDGNVVPLEKRFDEAERDIRFSSVIDDKSGVKEQVRANLDTINSIAPVLDINTQKYFGLNTGDARLQIIMDLESSGFVAHRDGFGDVDLNEKLLNKSLNYSEKTEKAESARRIAFLAIKPVIEKGRQIYTRINHKGRGYDTYTFAAPVNINGKHGIVGVIVRKTTSLKYDVHRVLAPDGTVFGIEKEAEMSTDWGASKDGAFTNPTNSASEDMVTPSGNKVNSKFSTVTDADRTDKEVKKKRTCRCQESGYAYSAGG